MVVRKFLVENLAFDDRQLKTLGLNKQTALNLNAHWGSIKILLYSAGAEIPPDKQASVKVSSKATADPQVQVPSYPIPKP